MKLRFYSKEIPNTPHVWLRLAVFLLRLTGTKVFLIADITHTDQEALLALRVHRPPKKGIHPFHFVHVGRRNRREVSRKMDDKVCNITDRTGEEIDGKPHLPACLAVSRLHNKMENPRSKIVLRCSHFSDISQITVRLII